MKHTARKRFGQNFLQDTQVIDSIVRAIGPRQDDHLVEIGPGLGALTQNLLGTRHLTLIELDRDLASQLRIAFVTNDNVTLIEGDALKIDLSDLPDGARLVGNLPYNVGTALVLRFLEWQRAKDMTFMLQKEVVERLCAGVGHKHYGRLAIVTACYAQTEHLFDVPPEAFDPAPKVDSAIVRLTPFEPEFERPNMEVLEAVTQKAFAQRRKTLRNNFKGWFNEAQLTDLGVDPGARAETLEPAVYARIARAWEKQNG